MGVTVSVLWLKRGRQKFDSVALYVYKFILFGCCEIEEDGANTPDLAIL